MSLWASIVEGCESIEECVKGLEEFFKSMCPDPSLCEEPPSGVDRSRYLWIEKLVELGVPDGRSRLVLYIISRYLVNVKGLSLEDAERVVDIFIENSCRNHGNCGKIYRTWTRRVLESVKNGGWKPWNLTMLKERDEQLYEIIASVIGLKE